MNAAGCVSVLFWPLRWLVVISSGHPFFRSAFIYNYHVFPHIEVAERLVAKGIQAVAYSCVHIVVSNNIATNENILPREIRTE